MVGGLLWPLLAAPALAAPPCCAQCTLPQRKYVSVDASNGYCGESCLNPAYFDWYKKLEPNLTLATDAGCILRFAADGELYSNFIYTDYHGIPDVFTVAVDMYAVPSAPDHRCCAPANSLYRCLGKPKRVTIGGVSFCCPISHHGYEKKNDTSLCPKPPALPPSGGVALPKARGPGGNTPARTNSNLHNKADEARLLPVRKKWNSEQCPDNIEAMRSQDVVFNFETQSIAGLWYEQAFIDTAQVAASCQTLNGTVRQDKVLSVDFTVKYYWKVLPFTLVELYYPNSTYRGLFTKRVQVPGGQLLTMRTVIVDSQPDFYILYSCIDPLGVLPAVNEFWIATRSKKYDKSLIKEHVKLAQNLGVPFSPSELQFVDHDNC